MRVLHLGSWMSPLRLSTDGCDVQGDLWRRPTYGKLQHWAWIDVMSKVRLAAFNGLRKCAGLRRNLNDGSLARIYARS